MTDQSAARPAPEPRNAYRAFVEMRTRWRDVDIYGHMNNAVYYEYFDTGVNQWLVEQGVLDPHRGAQVGLVVETGCVFFAEINFPARVTAGLRVARLGTSSVRYEIGLFADDAADTSAKGHFVHVYVDKQTRRPAPLNADLRSALENIET
ncbi:MAG: thioesterase family protein [Pseudomonadota bacterium]